PERFPANMTQGVIARRVGHVTITLDQQWNERLGFQPPGDLACQPERSPRADGLQDLKLLGVTALLPAAAEVVLSIQIATGYGVNESQLGERVRLRSGDSHIPGSDGLGCLGLPQNLSVSWIHNRWPDGEHRVLG